MSRHAAITRIRGWPALPVALELFVLAVVIADFVRIVVRLLSLEAALHWDEAVYANRARAWVEPDIPLSGWSYVRSPLVPMVGSLAVLAGGEEWQLRVVGLLAGVLLLGAAWWIARALAGPVAGLAATAILALSPTLQVEAAALLTDVPAAALVLVLVAIVRHELDVRERPGPGLVLAALLAGTTFLVRYGAILAIGPLLLVAVALWWRRLLAAPRVTAAAAVVGLVFVVGHFAWSVGQTGEPLGVMFGAQQVVIPDRAGVPTFDEYLKYVPFMLGGRIGFVAMGVGIVGSVAVAVAAMRSARWRPLARGVALLVLIGILHVAALSRGIAHAEPRYFILPTALFVVAGCAVTFRAGLALPRPARIGGVAVLAVALVLAHPASARYSHDRVAFIADYYRPYQIAALAIRAAADDDCGIVGGGDPILAWYSECQADRLRLQPDGGSPGRILDAGERWAVLFTPLDALNRDGAIEAQILRHAVGDPLPIVDPATGREFAVAWRLAE